ncbi:hydrogenase 4 subunit D [candidate division KSB1 bacterium]|nr:hydrogenase 4 subunit D [candidate division KSB1 bacterium]
MSITTLVLVLFIIPILGAVIAGLLKQKISDIVALIVAFTTMVCGIILAVQVYPDLPAKVMVQVGVFPWLDRNQFAPPLLETTPETERQSPVGPDSGVTVPAVVVPDSVLLDSNAVVSLVDTVNAAIPPVVVENKPASPDIILTMGYLLDPLSVMLLLVVIVIGFLVVLYSLSYLGSGNREHDGTEGKVRHHFWLLFFIAAMVGVALSANFLQLYIFWELTTLCSWALISHNWNAQSLRAGFKALLMTVFGGLFFATAIAIIFIQTKTFEFNALTKLAPHLRSWVFFFILLAGWAKSAQVPFFTWLPDAMAAPTTVSTYLHAAAMVKAGVYLVARTAISSFDQGMTLSYNSGAIVAVMASLTMLIALFLFFFQDDLKRLLAYSTIAHLAYILFGVGIWIMASAQMAGVGVTHGLTGSLMHIMNHAASKGLLFLCVGAIAYGTGIRSIKELSGLIYRMPLVSITFLVGMLSLLGVPPFAGFWSKFFLLIGVVELGGVAGWLLLIPFLLEIIVAFAWFLRVGHKVFFGEVSDPVQHAVDPPLPITFSLVTLAILCIIVPFIALKLVHLIKF